MCANNNNNEGPKKGLKSECTLYKYSNKGKDGILEVVILSGHTYPLIIIGTIWEPEVANSSPSLFQ